jgi:hypothetical protein
MAIVILEEPLTASQLEKARAEYSSYIKITVDLLQEVVAIGGEYHADAERLLLEKHGSKQRDIWGGGYNINSRKYETIAMINLRARNNPSMDILDERIRKQFLDLVKRKLKNMNHYL